MSKPKCLNSQTAVLNLRQQEDALKIMTALKGVKRHKDNKKMLAFFGLHTFKPHPGANPDCEGCSGLGWSIFERQGWGDDRYKEYDRMLAVQKCDECGVYKSDEKAGLVAFDAGVECQLEYPCVTLRQMVVPCHLHVRFLKKKKGDARLPRFIDQTELRRLGYKGAAVRVVAG